MIHTGSHRFTSVLKRLITGTGFDLPSVCPFQCSNPNSSVYIIGHYYEYHQFNISIFPYLIVAIL